MSLDEAVAQLSGEGVVWLGALSFEERCSGALAAAVEAGAVVNDIVLLDYATRVHPAAQERRRTEANRRELAKLCSEATRGRPGSPFLRTQAHVFRAAQAVFGRLLESPETKTVVLDITCLTKLHTIALGYEVATSERRVNWLFTYTSPDSYGRRRVAFGWNDVLVLPIGDDAALANESRSRGIVIPGDEADRLVVALAELAPSAGTVIYANDPTRLDLRLETEKQNKRAIRELAAARSENWSTAWIPPVEIGEFRDVIGREVAAARREDAPIFLFPFGPKPFVFFAAAELAATHSQRAWFIYPIPVAYDAEYSVGINDVLWYGEPAAAA